MTHAVTFGELLDYCEELAEALYRYGRHDRTCASHDAKSCSCGFMRWRVAVHPNPSTADAVEDDPTIRRCLGFTETLGRRELTVVNLYAYRATDPEDLHLAEDPVGPDCDYWIDCAATAADQVIVAWGADVGPIADRGEQVLKLLERCGAEPETLAVTPHGRPRHPLYLKADVKPEPYEWKVAHACTTPR